MTKSANKPKHMVSTNGDVKQHKNERHVVKEVRNIARPDLRYTQLHQHKASVFVLLSQYRNYTQLHPPSASVFVLL